MVSASTGRQNEVVETGVDHELLNSRLIEGGADGQERGVRQRWPGPDLAGQVGAAPRHHDVNDRDVGRLTLDGGQPRGHVFGQHDPVARFREQVSEQLAVARHVVDHENDQRHGATPSDRSRQNPCSDAPPGSGAPLADESTAPGRGHSGDAKGHGSSRVSKADRAQQVCQAPVESAVG
jgi:hypothetical protein